MSAAAAFAKFKAGDGDDFDSGLSHFCDGMCIAFVRDDYTRFQRDRIVGIVPLLAFTLITISARFDDFQLFDFERIRHCR